MRRWVCMAMMVTPLSMLAQSADSTRTQYVETFHDYFFLWPLLKQRSTSFEVRRADNKGQALTFRPNNAFTGGLGLYLFELGVEVTFAIPIDEKKTALYGTSHAFDLQVNLLTKHWGADVFYQRYGGFYLTDSDNPVPANTPYPQRPDLVTENFGINGIYFFNKKKFSFRSAYNFAERQKKSAGSFLLAGTLNSYHLETDSVLYGKRYQPLFGKDSDTKEFRSTSFSVAPGYSYTLIVGNFFLNGALSVGPALYFVEYNVQGVTGQVQKVNSFSDLRVGFGYNGARFFSGVTFAIQSRNVRMNEVQLTASSSTFRLLVGYRFREVGILKKRAVDFLPHRKQK